MANRTCKPLRGNGNGTKVLTWQIAPNGGSTPTIADNPDKVVASVSRTGAGVIQVTLSEKYLALRAVSVHLQLNAAGNSFAQVTGATAVNGAKTITVTTLTAGAAADIAANANNILHFVAVMKDSAGQ